MRNEIPKIKNDLNLSGLGFDTQHFCEQRNAVIEHRDCLDLIFNIEDSSKLRTCRLCPIGFAIARTAPIDIKGMSEDDLALAIRNTEEHKKIFPKASSNTSSGKPVAIARPKSDSRNYDLMYSRLLGDIARANSDDGYGKSRPRKNPVSDRHIYAAINALEKMEAQEKTAKNPVKKREQTAEKPYLEVKPQPELIAVTDKQIQEPEAVTANPAEDHIAVSEPVVEQVAVIAEESVSANTETSSFAILKEIIILVRNKYPTDKHFGVRFMAIVANNNGYESITHEILESDIRQAGLKVKKAGKSLFLMNDDILQTFIAR